MQRMLYFPLSILNCTMEIIPTKTQDAYGEVRGQ